jgi:hypothetical protein
MAEAGRASKKRKRKRKTDLDSLPKKTDLDSAVSVCNPDAWNNQHDDQHFIALVWS